MVMRCNIFDKDEMTEVEDKKYLKDVYCGWEMVVWKERKLTQPSLQIFFKAEI